MILPRIPILSSIFGPFWRDRNAAHPEGEHARAQAARDGARDLGLRWSKAMTRDPDLRLDLIRLGGLLVLPPVENVGGYPQPATMDHYQCGREAGRRELATQLLAAGGMTMEDFNQLMEDDNVHQ